jgi:hypothetical protein
MLHKPLFRGKSSRGDGLPRPVGKKDPSFLRMTKLRKGRLLRSTPTPTALVGSPSRSLGITYTLGDRGPSPEQGSHLQKKSPSHPPAAPSPSKDGVKRCKQSPAGCAEPAYVWTSPTTASGTHPQLRRRRAV